ncbi:transforming acidic coiled-coil-containing protein 3 isoform X2 [Teleopsis dalmanni]|uniref:transforming acidic coiled-coil-containing protein 3 isoform X2 n=1 Tax=Teleopsis dalmanni TaxID=139649 RepID=UPI0018CDC8C2|nr:transforming acidic coiled-coil-containing protein 3 isoform X2 [Teleopsis dalmanni]
MDFFSNLIKRPMSLVLGDEHDTASTPNDIKLSATSRSEPQTPNDEDLSALASVSKNRYAAIKKYSEQLEFEDGLGDLCAVTTHTYDASSPPKKVAKSVIRSPPKSRKSNDVLSSPFSIKEQFTEMNTEIVDILNKDMIELSPTQSNTSNSSNLHTNSSKTNIMLTEINTNMDKMLNEYPMNSMNIIPTIKLSQISNKAATMAETKLSVPSSQPQIKVTGPTPNASPSPTAGSAGYEANSLFSPSTGQKISDSPTSSTRPIGGTNKSSHKFIGLTEFDESEIPELPDCLNPNIEENVDIKNSFPLKENLLKDEINSSDSEAYNECEAIEAEFQKLKKLAAAELLGDEFTKNTLDEIESAFNRSAYEPHAKESWQLNVTNNLEVNPSEPMDIDLNFTNTDISVNNYFDVEQENLEKSLNKSIEMPRKLNSSLTQESVPEFSGASASGIVAQPVIRPTLNLTLDMSSSFCSARSSAPSSPAFPISNINDINEPYRFPQSPTSANKGIIYLEKSDYAKKLNDSNKFISDFRSNSPQLNLVNENNGLNTLDSPLGLNSNDVALNSIFNNNQTLPITTAKRTFTVSSLDTNESVSDSHENDITPQTDLTTIIDKSVKNNFVNANDSTEESNTMEDMDVDVSMKSLHENSALLYLTPKEKLNLKTGESEKASTPLTGEHNNLFATNGLERECSKTPLTPIPQSQPNIGEPDYNSPFYQLFSPVVTMEKRQKEEELIGNIQPKCLNIPNVITMAERQKMDEDVLSENQLSSSKRSASPPITTIKTNLQEDDLKMFSECSSPTSKSPPIPTLQKQYKPNNIDIVSEDKQSKTEYIADLVNAIEINVVSSSELRASPPIPTITTKLQEDLKMFSEYSLPCSTSPPIPTLQKQYKPNNIDNINEDKQSKTEYVEDLADLSPLCLVSPPIPTLNKAPAGLSEEDNTKSFSPSMHSKNKRATTHSSVGSVDSSYGEVLSAKEQTKCNARDEKDVENISTSQINDLFVKKTLNKSQSIYDDEFKSGNTDANVLFDAAAFDYLLSKGNTNIQENRSSLLLKFDPLLGVPVATTSQQSVTTLSPTIEEEENCGEDTAAECAKVKPKEGSINKNETMSITMTKDIHVENDCKKSYDNSNSQSDVKQNDYQMDELEKKIKNEVLKTEDIEKKLKDAESREENYIKRITEKDKAIYKMHSVIEAYEKAIAELISEKEQIVQSYEKQILEIKSDRDSNYQHLTSLETTFSDLHVKYEKSKEMTLQLKKTEEVLLNEKAAHLENIRSQEKRYEKMKLHAMQQLEFANNKLELMSKEHHIEAAKLKASLKKEELARASLSEQLQQKARENNELVKICDELINGQGS